MAARRWTVVCAGVLLAGTYAGPVLTQEQAGAAATAVAEQVPSDLRPLLAKPLSEFRLVTQRYTLDRSTLNGNYDGGRSGRGGGRGQGGPGGPAGGRGAGTAAPATPARANANLALDQSRCEAEAVRHELARGAQQARRRQADRSRAGRPRRTEDDHRRQPEATGSRHRDDRRGPAGGAIRAGAGAPERDAHQAAGRQFPGRRRAARQRDEGNRGDAGKGRGRTQRHRSGHDSRRQGNRHEGGDRCRRSSQQHHDLVQLLQRLRSAVHVVDGNAVQGDRHGAAGVLDVPARHRRCRRPPGPAGAGGDADPAGRIDAAVRRSRPAGDHRAAAGRDDRGRPAVRRASWRPRRPRRH